MKCPRCNGRKYIELDKIGLVVKACPECNGTGEGEDNKIIETQVANDDRDRTEPDNSDTGSGDTCKPVVAKKPKAKRKRRKKAS